MQIAHRFHQFDPVIYPYNVWVMINNNPHIISLNFLEDDKSEIIFTEKENRKAIAFTIPAIRKETGEYGVILFFRNKKSMTHKLVAHEATHAAKHLFEHIGADIKPHEPFEYVVGWIAECCDIARKYNNKKI